MSIASIHNHPVQYGAPPSGKNFEMLGLEFEEFELISSQNELWILESCEKLFSDDYVKNIRDNVDKVYNSLYYDITLESDDDCLNLNVLNKRYGDFLLNYINEFNNIKLIRRYLYE